MSKPEAVFNAVKEISRSTYKIKENTVNRVLTNLAELIVEKTHLILKANEEDLSRIDYDKPKYDRLKLTPERLTAIANTIHAIAEKPYLVGKISQKKKLKNGLLLQKMNVPIGVIGIIYEARPGIILDSFALCLKSGNVCLLKGTPDDEITSKTILNIIHEVLVKHKLSPNIIQLLPVERFITELMLKATDYIDLIIPRGSRNLIQFVKEYAKVPVIETEEGVVHTYFDETASAEKSKNIILNAKTRRVGLSNTLDCLLVHQSRLSAVPELCKPLADRNIIIYADEYIYSVLQDNYPENLLHFVTDNLYASEFLDYKIAIRVVNGLTQALEHIAKYSAKHSEAILSEDKANIRTFLHSVDAAVVYANASTAFTDGHAFDMGSEIGISTQKLHARGPMGVSALLSYKWVVQGDGHIR